MGLFLAEPNWFSATQRDACFLMVADSKNKQNGRRGLARAQRQQQKHPPQADERPSCRVWRPRLSDSLPPWPSRRFPLSVSLSPPCAFLRRRDDFLSPPLPTITTTTHHHSTHHPPQKTHATMFPFTLQTPAYKTRHTRVAGPLSARGRCVSLCFLNTTPHRHACDRPLHALITRALSTHTHIPTTTQQRAVRLFDAGATGKQHSPLLTRRLFAFFLRFLPPPLSSLPGQHCKQQRAGTTFGGGFLYLLWRARAHKTTS